MTTPPIEQLVVDYLARLDRAASTLPSGERADLVQEIREHIDTAMEGGTVSDEAGMHTLLDRLGEPEVIVASARGRRHPKARAATGCLRRRPGRAGLALGGLEIATVILLGVGAVVIPILGPLVGLILLWSSSQWTRRQKRIGTAITVLPTLLGVVLLFLYLLTMRR